MIEEILKQKRFWKVLAILFIILFLSETTFVIWFINLGIKTIEKENECSFNICEDFQSYSYDSVENICYCFENGELIKHKFLS